MIEDGKFLLEFFDILYLYVNEEDEEICVF